MFAAREHLQELAEHQLEPGLRFGRPQRLDGRLRADDELDLGHEVRDQLAVAPQRLAQPARASRPCTAGDSASTDADQAATGSRHGGEGDRRD